MTSAAGRSSGRSPSLISRFICSIRSPLTPSKETTRASAIRASLSLGPSLRLPAHRRASPGRSRAVTRPLWAPWRLEYVGSADEQEGCIFCRARDAPGRGRPRRPPRRACVRAAEQVPVRVGPSAVAPLRHTGSSANSTPTRRSRSTASRPREWARWPSSTSLRGTTWAGTSGGSPARGSPTMCTCTSFLGGRETRTSCPSWRT